MIVYHSQPVTLVGGGYLGKSDLDRAMSIGSHLVAADGGAYAAMQAGLSPKAVIGDFDSLDTATRAALRPDILHHIPEQDSTDFDKCLRNIQAPLVLGVGFTGARIDHHLANFNTLVRYPDRRCILLGGQDITFLAPPSFSIDLEPDTPVSLFPMGAVEGVSDGLKWPIAGLTFTPDGRVGTSNQATGPISLSLTSPKMLMILPAILFEKVAQTLLENTATWATTS